MRSVCTLPRNRETRLVSKRVCCVTPPGAVRREVSDVLSEGVNGCVSSGGNGYRIFTTPFTICLSRGAGACIRPSISIVYSPSGLSSEKYGKTPS